MNHSNFISYLDNINTQQSAMNFEDLSKLVCEINNQYIQNQYYQPGFCGISYPLYYAMLDKFNTSTYVSLRFHKTHPSMGSTFASHPAHPHLPTQSNKKNKYHKKISLKPNNQFFQACSTDLPPIRQIDLSLPPTPTPREKVNIDIKIDTIKDILKILELNSPIDKTKEYNIDLETLAKIRPELEELDAMVGMQFLKKSILEQLLYFMQELHLHPDGITATEGDYKHTVIYGPPGTGKTEIAKIIGRMYSRIGILSKNVFKKVTRNDLVAGYLGQTAIKTKAVITECLGGVLFIDEAYSLSNSNDLDSFSKECIDTLCESLSDNKENLMVIIAGYETELDRDFFSANPGLESRFVWRFHIDKYTADEMRRIFLKKIAAGGWKIGVSTLETKWFEKNRDSFQNYGRDMELLFFHTKICHSKRIYGNMDAEKRVISMDDLESGLKMFLSHKKKKNGADDAIRKIMETLYI